MEQHTRWKWLPYWKFGPWPHKRIICVITKKSTWEVSFYHLSFHKLLLPLWFRDFFFQDCFEFFLISRYFVNIFLFLTMILNSQPFLPMLIVFTVTELALNNGVQCVRRTNLKDFQCSNKESLIPPSFMPVLPREPWDMYGTEIILTPVAYGGDSCRYYRPFPFSFPHHFLYCPHLQTIFRISLNSS